MARVDEQLARFDRKSPQDAYKQICEELGVHMQRDIYNLLPETPMAYHRITSLELDQLLLGTKGCMALLPIILCSNTLRKISLRTCGISDEFVKELCEILQAHPSVRAVDISENELVTVYSAPFIISLMKHNSNMVSFDVEKTHVGTNVGNIIASLGQKNMMRVATYYQDNYFKMKDLFNYLDENGYGWVMLKSLVMNCPYPILQEQFVERIAMKKPRKRSDNTISLNTFLQLVYMNYKSESEIAQYAENEIDEPYVFMCANWKQIISAVDRFNEARTQQAEAPDQKPTPEVKLPEKDFHRLRMREYLLTNDDADALVAGAVQLQLDEEGGESGDALEVSILNLIRASKCAFIPPPSTKPEYTFFKDRDAAFIPSIMRNGSRLFSVGKLDCLDSSSAAGRSNSSVGAGSSRASVVADPSDPPRTFSLPSSLVKMVIDFFNKEFSKLPKKKDSVIPDSPRTKKDKAMEKSSIPVETFLSAEFVTDFERVCPRLLADYFARYALPIVDCTITLQEMVNVLDELYVSIRVDNIVPFEVIAESIENPLKDPRYAEFLTKHLLERDEEVNIIEPLRASVSC